MYKFTLLSVFFLFVLLSCNQKKETVPAIKNPVELKKVNKATPYITAKDTDERLAKKPEINFTDYSQPPETQPCVFLDPKNTFQTFIGIGSALTDASAEVFSKLPEEKQKEFLDAHFDKEKGNAYTFMRTNIASCDFSGYSYDYVEEGDAELNTFNISHDKEFRIPFIKKCVEAADGKLKIFASPWSPPGWMKDNNDRLHGGKLLDEYKQPWANHFVRFIQEYEKEGIDIWGLTVQNEPMAVQIWESCIFTAEEERDFVKSYLGPTLEKAGMGDKKLIVWDHNRDLIYHRASTILNDVETSKYIWGIGFHWYETWTGSAMQFENLKLVNETFPEKKLVFTEGTPASFNPERYNSWQLGEKYGLSMINDFNCGTVAWTDWNILLDEKGGPNHVENFCFAPVHADLRTNELIYTNSYYYIGHFSRFIKLGAKRIACSASRDKLQATAFLNPDGGIVVVVMNMSDEEINYKLWIEGKAADVTSKGHSIATFTF